MFKSKFSGWDEVIAVDFTRTAESVQKTGADLTKWARQQETKVCWKQYLFVADFLNLFLLLWSWNINGILIISLVSVCICCYSFTE
jgi:hypothetical protein